jgi:hypothetical protein
MTRIEGDASSTTNFNSNFNSNSNFESMMAHEAEIIIPGSFVVLQGSSGDGISNTMESLPPALPLLNAEEELEEAEIGAENEDQETAVQQEQQSQSQSQPQQQQQQPQQQQQQQQPLQSSSEHDYQHVANVVCVEETASTTPPRQRATATATPPTTTTTATTTTTTRTTILGQLASTATRLNSRTLVGSLSSGLTVPSIPHSHSYPQITIPIRQPTIHSSASDFDSDSYMVVTDELDPSPHRSTTTARTANTNTNTNININININTALTSPLRREWKQHCRERELTQQREWRECVVQMCASPLNHVFMKTHDQETQHQTQHQTQQQTQQHPEWWLGEGGKVAILRDVPAQLSNGTVLRSVMGTLPPGFTIVATDIVYLHSHTLERVAVRATTSSGGTAPHNIYPRGRPGWIVLVKLVVDPHAMSSTTSSSSSSRVSPYTAMRGGMGGSTSASSSSSSRTGYAVLSVDGYPLLAPGVPSLYVDPHVWVWRVTCPAGAYVRSGLDLSTHHLETLPYGSLVRVTRRTVNAQGLSRLRITALFEEDPVLVRRSRSTTTTQHVQQPTAAPARLVDGWCSEFLNPLSGNRGGVLEPLSFPVPALYRITLSIGAVVRQSVELSSPQSGVVIPMGAIVKVTGRAFSEHPIDKCIERLQLAGHGGWISVRLNRPPPQDDLIVELVGVDSTFDPEAPETFHWRRLEEVQVQQQSHRPEPSRTIHNSITTNNNNTSTTGELSSVDSTSSTESNANRNTNTNTNTNHVGNIELCLICQTEERNATIVHGETGHVACCLGCARILKARGDKVCPMIWIMIV